MSMHNVIVTFELKDGRELRCEYGYSYYYGSYWHPPETDVGDPTYYLDDVEVSPEQMPKGLDAIAEAMYEADKGDLRFKFHDEINDPFDGTEFDYEV